VKYEPDICKRSNKLAARCRERDIIQPSTELRYVTYKRGYQIKRMKAITCCNSRFDEWDWSIHRLTNTQGHLNGKIARILQNTNTEHLLSLKALNLRKATKKNIRIANKMIGPKKIPLITSLVSCYWRCITQWRHHLGCRASDDMNDELGRIWKETVVAVSIFAWRDWGKHWKLGITGVSAGIRNKYLMNRSTDQSARCHVTDVTYSDIR
jgi:hypothetical protein